MAVTRKTHITRVRNQDSPDEIWLDVERIDTITVETGTGFSYQKTTYRFDWAELEALEAAFAINDGDTVGGRKITIKSVCNPQDETQIVKLAVMDRVSIETGSGFSYQKTFLTFDNTQDNEKRVVRIDRIYHRDDNDGPVDLTQYVDQEVVRKLTVQNATGFTYQRDIFTIANDALPGARETLSA